MKIWRYPPRREYKPRDPAVTSKMMAAVKGKGGKAERLLRSTLWRRGYRFRLHTAGLIGKPDIVLPRFQTVIFVDSDFWHARTLVAEGEAALRATIRGERQDWWINKLCRNADRDAEVTEGLRREGWTVIRIWESEVLADVGSVADRVEKLLARSIQRKRADRERA